MDRRVTSPTWGPSPPCKKALPFTWWLCFWRLTTAATWNFLISRARLWSRCNFLFFFFLNVNKVLSDSNPENFANIWRIKWNWIRNSANIHFLSAVFGLLSFRNFATMATWRNDFSSLLTKRVRVAKETNFSTDLLPFATFLTLTQWVTEVLVGARKVAPIFFVFFIVTRTKFIPDLTENISRL